MWGTYRRRVSSGWLSLGDPSERQAKNRSKQTGAPRGMLLAGALWACAACFLSGCTAQLGNNTVDLALSLNALVKRQIFFNLAQSFLDPGFVPAQVTIVSGSAETTFSVSPTLTVPLGPTLAGTAAATVASVPQTSFQSVATSAAPGLQLGASNISKQNWTISPINDSGEFRRLRALYNYATGQIDAGDFLCEYPVQSLALPLHTKGGNVELKVNCGKPIYADPNFVRNHNCILCGEPDASGRVTPTINPKLIPRLVSRQQDDSHNARVGSANGVDLYVCDGCPGNVDGKRAFGDFVIFVYEAMLQTTGGAREDTYVAPGTGSGSRVAPAEAPGPTRGSGKAPAIAPFIFSVPLQ